VGPPDIPPEPGPRVLAAYSVGGLLAGDRPDTVRRLLKRADADDTEVGDAVRPVGDRIGAAPTCASSRRSLWRRPFIGGDPRGHRSADFIA
jgi:hypothetical protein